MLYALILIAYGANNTPTALTTVPGFHSRSACMDAGLDIHKNTQDKVFFECIVVK